MSMKWRVRSVPVEEALENGTDGEPFALDLFGHEKMVLTKQEYFEERDERKSSVHEENRNAAGNEADRG